MGKSSAPIIGFWYRLAFHIGITPRPIDAMLEVRGGDKTAWQGSVTASGTFHVDAPKLWGGEKDQGGIVGDFDVMFGEPTQVPNPYLVSTFGDQTVAWRGCTTIAFKGGRYGAMNPYAQKPSFKFRRIKQGWDGECWYPEKAAVPQFGDGGTPFTTTYGAEHAWSYTTYDSWDGSLAAPGVDFSAWPTGAGDFDSDPTGDVIIPWGIGTGIVLRFNLPPGTTSLELHADYVDDTLYVYNNGVEVGKNVVMEDNNIGIGSADIDPNGTNEITIRLDDEIGAGRCAMLGLVVTLTGVTPPPAQFANPAHVLYETLIDSEMGREPVENLDDASFRAGADKFYSAGFGICPKRDPSQESVEDFQKRICKLAGCSISRSLVDGKWYLDLAWGDYDIDTLPIVTDDDILGFKEAPTTQDDAVNSVSVKYFDPEKKTSPITPPVRSLALVAAFGTIHQTYGYPEIPTAELAARVAKREMLATTTPTRGFDLVCKPTIYALRPNQYFRLQAPKRGIADMVCLVGQKEAGTLKSGAIKLKATQDIYSMPTTSFVQVEPGVDTRPPQTPNAIALERAIEAPYIEVCAAMTRADLAVLPPETGFVMAVAAAPASELDFNLMVDAGAGYDDAGIGHWAATATVNESANRIATAFTLANAKLLDQVTVGMGALWDGEIVRVDAIDAGAGTITLGRGCADTVPQTHAANSRLFFYEVGMGYDTTEYTDGETIDVKLLSNTGSQQLALASATPMAITFDQRQARPYPPAKLRINTEADPSYLFGALTVGWVHRDRVLQADQLVDNEAATIGPEAGTTYTMRTYLDNVLDDTQTGIAGTSATVTPSGDGTVRIEVEAVRDSLASWQANTREFAYTTAALDPLELQDGSVLQTQGGVTIYLQS